MRTPESRILGWSKPLQPDGSTDDEPHHAVIARDDAGDVACACGKRWPAPTPHCFHPGRQRAAYPRCVPCDVEAESERLAEARLEVTR